jgi:hypothetical protein
VTKLVVVLLLLRPTLQAQSRELELTAGYNYQTAIRARVSARDGIRFTGISFRMSTVELSAPPCPEQRRAEIS